MTKQPNINNIKLVKATQALRRAAREVENILDTLPSVGDDSPQEDKENVLRFVTYANRDVEAVAFALQDYALKCTSNETKLH